MAIRAASHRIGGSLLERLLNADGKGYQGGAVDCAKGHRARFVEHRGKELITVLAPVSVSRAYYHCEACGEGVIPKDVALDIVDTGFSPGVRRMMGQVGGKEAFEDGGKDLEVLAGVLVTTKAVERISDSALDELVVTDTIPLSPAAAGCKRIRVLSIAGLLAETMLRISNEDSVSSLFVE